MTVPIFSVVPDGNGALVLIGGSRTLSDGSITIAEPPPLSQQIGISLGPLDLGGSYYTVDGYGTMWCATTWPGTGSPGSSMQTTQKTAGPGAWLGPAAQLNPRSVPVNGWAVAQSPTLLQAANDALNAACTLEATPLRVTVDGVARWLLVRRQGDVVWQPRNGFVADWSIQVEAVDPRWFADAISDSTGLPSAVGGLTVPFTVPFTIDETVVSGAVSLTQPGTADSAPTVVRFDGPCTAPIVTHLQTGRRVAFRPGFSLGEGEFVTVDMESGQVLAQGQASRAGSLIEYGFQPAIKGVNTWLFTTSGSFQPLARMGVYMWPSWK